MPYDQDSQGVIQGHDTLEFSEERPRYPRACLAPIERRSRREFPLRLWMKDIPHPCCLRKRCSTSGPSCRVWLP